MHHRFPILLTAIVLSLCSSALSAGETRSLRTFDAGKAIPAEVARDARASAPGALFRITGLRGADGEALTLDLETAPLFAADFHLYVDGRAHGREAVERLTMLRGTVEQWPGSSVALTVNSATGAWNGLLVAGDQVYEVALPAGVTHGSIADSASVKRATVESLLGGAASDVLEPPLGLQKELDRAAKSKIVVGAPGAEYQATIDIESDFELFQRFGSVETVTEYLAGVVADVSELYFRQLGVTLAINDLFLYTSPDDPWEAPNPHSGATADVLCEFASYWQRLRPVRNFPRNGAMFFTGKASNDIGGQAWLSSLCSYTARPSACPYGGYGIVVVTNRAPRDTVVTAHELGHVFGSKHTHCYNPPIDTCHSGETGCYEGPESLPADGGGSVMSYCSPIILSMGEPGRFGVDSQRVEDVIRGLVNAVGPSCLARTNDPYALAGEAAPASATLSWIDPFSNEANWLVEQRLPNGKFKQVKSLPANSTGVTITKLKRGDQAFRVRAKFKKDFSDYSNVVTVTVP